MLKKILAEIQRGNSDLRQIAETLGMQPSAVQEAIDTLVKGSYLEMELGGGASAESVCKSCPLARKCSSFGKTVVLTEKGMKLIGERS